MHTALNCALAFSCGEKSIVSIDKRLLTQPLGNEFACISIRRRIETPSAQTAPLSDILVGSSAYGAQNTCAPQLIEALECGG
ncbi:hypothetical protein [Thauera humireducens]|uniref:hypothetical protein n=1 Tax=Thauera humireducens TaxID=1134435 RepID=UPI00311D7251